MRRESIIVTLTVFIALAMPSHSSANHPDTADFTLVKISQDISVYERWYPLAAGLSAREVKATFIVRAEPAHAAALIRNESKGRTWNRNVKTYKVVPAHAASWVCYIEYELPWPVSNQDCVLQYSMQHSSDSLEISFIGIEHPLFPHQKRTDRIGDVRGRWIFIPTRDGIVVEYYITTTPSNTLPSWVTDPIIRSNLIETLSSFRKVLETQTF